MPLVDYPSDSDDSASASGTDHRPEPPPKKKPRTASPPRSPRPGAEAQTTSTGPSPTPALPPLPPSFHDLYASTVRTTTRDDPALHQGRTRQTPHVPGNWPSHVYIEWHPPPTVHSLLSDLLSSLQEQTAQTSGVEITSFLQSDLGTPLPLHVSLSRPVALSTEEKDGFLAEVEAAIGASGVAAFALKCSKVEWHRTAESGRSFLVLRVRSSSSNDSELGPNPELTELLRRCNSVVAGYNQPELYQWAAAEGGGEDGETRVGEAFHVSIAWSFAEVTKELVRATERVFGGEEARRKLQEVQVPVEGVKVKIGNVVTHVALRQPGGRVGERKRRNLLGL